MRLASNASLTVLILALLPGSCGQGTPDDVDDAGEAVVRHFLQEMGAWNPDGPWEVVCLRREEEAGRELDEDFLRRFEESPLPVVSSRGCRAADEEGHAWVEEETGRVAFEVVLGPVRPGPEGSLVLEAGTSTATMDYARYDCTLIPSGEGWEVEECVPWIMT